ncbi:hypothetical protein D3C76_1484910 [compost metagenome]
MLMPAIMIRKPSRVLKVPSATLPIDFFCSNSPSMAIKATRMEAWPNRSLTIKSIRLFMAGFLHVTFFQEGHNLLLNFHFIGKPMQNNDPLLFLFAGVGI